MNGENDSETDFAKQQLKQFETILDEYNKTIGLSDVTYHPIEVERCLKLSHHEIVAFDEEECCNMQYMLQQYALFINKQYNRNKVRVEWAEYNLDRILAKEYNKYGDQYTKYHIKLQMIANNDVYAEKLLAIKRHASARMIDLEGVAANITLLARSLNDAKYSKRKHYESTRTA